MVVLEGWLETDGGQFESLFSEYSQMKEVAVPGINNTKEGKTRASK